MNTSTMKTVNPQHLTDLKNVIQTEFTKFRGEMINGESVDIFDRAQEIIIKTAIADEIINGFENTFDNMRDLEDQYALVETIWLLWRDNQWETLLDGLYLEYLHYQDIIFDPEILADFLSDKFVDWQMIWRSESETPDE